ncbi:hybrid sensor histidine kinase/response regulator [Chiayiivirga flava]|uniref:histidine kinase n=1 Tax=Chiayiivirga flava TaxID=659595 RepID=A0A7W8D2U4_9GAMM|nr:PAS-domain containing protein [Chiayiivirga flava]MBB5206819.1 PAS domain S-box-containing protein [Chiayiivirga flava]
MLSDAVVVAAGLLWLGLLFGAALWGERRSARLAKHWGAVYALSLAVYCTSWTFYGTVTQATRSGWPLPPTFIGTMLLYLFGIGVLLRLVRMAREHNSTSIADLIATRLGRNSWLAAAITAVALLGLIPYVALQLKAVAMSYGLLTGGGELTPSPWQDSALYIALAMALFAMLFGTRSAAAEHNPGLVLAMAVESLLKLGAMLVLGAFVVFGPHWPAPPLVTQPDGADGFPALIVLGVLAMFTLPHQFHVGVVEAREERHLRTARWLFPLYMALIALPLLPLARVGQSQLAPLGVPSDLYVLALPLSQGQGGLALLAFLGGLSAATGMVILATLSLSLMIGNHWLAPLRVRGAWAQPGGPSRRGEVLLQRRIGILAVVLLAWGYSRAIAGSDALADIGAVSFSALATIAPALGFALWRPQTPPRAVLLGLGAAVAMWLWTLLLPALAPLLWSDTAWLRTGPFGWTWLAPDAMFGLSGWSRLMRAVVLSLVAGALVPWLWSLRRTHAPPAKPAGHIDVAGLRDLAARFLRGERVEQIFAAASPDAVADQRLQDQVERDLAAVLGAASARLLIDTARTEVGPDLDTVAHIVGEASQASRFNQRLLEAALENMSQGISVVDRELRLVAWNSRYAELFGYPAELLQVGRPVQDLARWALARGFAGEARHCVDEATARRLGHMRAGTAHLSERRFPDGTIVEIRGNPMPGGGFVATFTDVTDFRRAEADLKGANETLEQRVGDRTRELDHARRVAERANQAKSRFLAAVSHDLLQPLHAAQLFTHALDERLQHDTYRSSVDSIRGALASTEALLGGLLDMSRLDAGRLQAQPRDFPLAQMLDSLAAEFSVLAAERGIALHSIPTALWAHSDPQLLRRVLLNFLSNAVRYTERGRIVFGVRRRGERLAIEVWDSGPGIHERERRVIFDEFRRGDEARGQGLGLGLAIAERIARLLAHPLTLRSWPGRGSVFAVEVPRALPGLPQAPPAEPEAEPARVGRVLVVDNDAAVLRAMAELLQGWGWQVAVAGDTAAALREVRDVDLVLLDYHLDDGDTGVDLYHALALRCPGIVITADRSDAVRDAVAAAGLALLHKPLRPLALRSVLNRVVSGRPAL